jgi:hypothetical protein
MNPYQQEQREALSMVVRHLGQLSADNRRRLQKTLQAYLDFRYRVDRFLEKHFSQVCTTSCFQSQRSACCSRDGIITFFADVVINALISESDDLDRLHAVLKAPHEGSKCVYLGRAGCLWRIKPIVCQMFLCDAAAEDVFGKRSDLKEQWEALKTKAQHFKWPDRPVLFDALEKYFIDAGCRSTLMYLHTSPGLLRVKKRAGLPANKLTPTR